MTGDGGFKHGWIIFHHMAGMSSFPLTKSIIVQRGRSTCRSTTNQMTMVLFYMRIHGFLSHNRCFFFLQMAGHEVFPNNWLLVHRTWYNCKTWGFRMQKKLHITRRHDGCTSLFEAIEATVIWCYLLVDPSNYGYIPSGNFTGWWFGTWLLWLSIHIGNVIIPTDELIFFRGVGLNHQPV